jgi:integrase/recombinase XerD
MATIKTILDTRRAKSDGTFNVIFRITHIKKVYTINSGVSLQMCFWNHKNCEVERAYPNSKLLNIKLSKEHFKIEQALLVLDDDFTIEKLKNMLSGKPTNEPAETFQVFSNKVIQQMFEANRTGNAIVYNSAVTRLINYCGSDVSFTDINYQLLDEFKHHLITSGLKQNSISNYFRSIRAIYNKAIKLKVVDRAYYPFYDITIKSEKTSKRAISKQELQKVIHIPLEENSTAWKSLNYFLLSFYLRGISFTDLAYLKHSNIVNGRIEFKRRKTHKNYSVKLFSPAETIINKLHREGNSYLLPILTNAATEDSLEAKKIINQWIKTTNKYLKRLSIQAGLSSSITTYTSRHSFATVAKRLGYSNELIAEALGHEYGNKITNIYLDTFDTEVLDAMHLQVISL